LTHDGCSGDPNAAGHNNKQLGEAGSNRGQPVPLSEVEQAWPKDDSTRRTVFTMDVQKF